jgi:hypothetical protein
MVRLTNTAFAPAAVLTVDRRDFCCCRRSARFCVFRAARVAEDVLEPALKRLQVALPVALPVGKYHQVLPGTRGARMGDRLAAEGLRHMARAAAEKQAASVAAADDADAAARWRVAISRAKVEAMQARAAAQAEAAVRADRLSKGFAAKPSPRERIQQQRMQVNRAEIYAMNAALARQAEARWRELCRENGRPEPEPEPAVLAEPLVPPQNTVETKQSASRSPSPVSMVTDAGRSHAQDTPPLTPPPSPPSPTRMTGDLIPPSKVWLEPAAVSVPAVPSCPSARRPAGQKPRSGPGSGGGGCCGYFHRRSRMQVVQQGQPAQQQPD